MEKKNIGFSLCIVVFYTLKVFGLYPKQLGILNCMCNFLKASYYPVM